MQFVWVQRLFFRLDKARPFGFHDHMLASQRAEGKGLRTLRVYLRFTKQCFD